MPETLTEFLRHRARRACRAFATQLDSITPEIACADADPEWETNPWSMGQNGSIAGIASHVTAWLMLTLPILKGGIPTPSEAFDPTSVPPTDDCNAVHAWFVQVSTEWMADLAALPDAEFDRQLLWEGETFTVAQYVVEMYEHFVYHDGQIQYLKQHQKRH